MIKNIIFDMGQVLIKFDPDEFIERAGVTDDADKIMIKREVYQSVEWPRMDRGSLTEEQAAQIMCGRLPERLHGVARQLIFDWDKPFIPVAGMADLVRELKENGYGIYLLSNASLRHKEYWNRIPGSEYFDGKVISAEEKLVKPQPEIYRLICERYNLLPEECVFIDDLTPNTEGAYYCGLNPIVFHGDIPELREKLSQLGVNVKR